MEVKLVSDAHNLLIDAGNSSLKLARHRLNDQIENLQIIRAELNDIEQYIKPARAIFLSSVLDDESSRVIEHIALKYQKSFIRCSALSHQFGITNAYHTPTNMGDDRWMAILAGCALSNKGDQTHVLVIDSGSAITCDFIIANKHIGGWIAPGLAMARDAVVAKTSRVFDRSQSLHSLDLGANTPECVANGVLAQISGMIKQAITIMEKKCSAFEIYISGGDANLLIKLLEQTKKEQR